MSKITLKAINMQKTPIKHMTNMKIREIEIKIQQNLSFIERLGQENKSYFKTYISKTFTKHFFLYLIVF